MLPKHLRASSPVLAKHISQGVVCQTHHLKLRAVPHSSTQVAFVVPKQLRLGAVMRNKLRRRGYDIVRPHLKDLSGPFLLTFFFVSGAERCSAKELKKEISTLFDKIRSPQYNTR